MNSAKRSEVLGALLLVVCVLVVAFWELMAGRSKRGFDPFALTAAVFSDFVPEVEGWRVRPVPVASQDPVEPNIFGCLLQPDTRGLVADGGPAEGWSVRLVHGYNVVDCMRIKGFRVERLADTRRGIGLGGVLTGNDQYQVWRLTSDTGETYPWISSMLQARDFEATNLDTRDMAFPRVGTPDHPGWAPQGLSLASLRHPIRNGRLFLRHKWNASRADLLTFLGLRRPAWASEELLTLVTSRLQPVAAGEAEEAAIRRALAVHAAMLTALQEWRRAGGGGLEVTGE